MCGLSAGAGHWCKGLRWSHHTRRETKSAASDVSEMHCVCSSIVLQAMFITMCLFSPRVSPWLISALLFTSVVLVTHFVGSCVCVLLSLFPRIWRLWTSLLLMPCKYALSTWCNHSALCGYYFYCSVMLRVRCIYFGFSLVCFILRSSYRLHIDFIF
jgi:hypothetical protein